VFDSGPMLRAHKVGDLEDRVKILQKLVWYGEAAFNKSHPPIGGLRDPQMRQAGLAVTEVCKARDDRCELEAIYEFVKANIRYTGDITYKDTFQSAFRTLQYGGGDCDDFSTLIVVLAMENGFQCKFRITSNYGPTWDHIYVMVGVPKLDPKQWVALDATLPGPGRFGKQPPMAKFRDFPVDEPT
jgi:Transglutaminase-like superfamily